MELTRLGFAEEAVSLTFDWRCFGSQSGATYGECLAGDSKVLLSTLQSKVLQREAEATLAERITRFNPLS